MLTSFVVLLSDPCIGPTHWPPHCWPLFPITNTDITNIDILYLNTMIRLPSYSRYRDWLAPVTYWTLLVLVFPDNTVTPPSCSPSSSGEYTVVLSTCVTMTSAPWLIQGFHNLTHDTLGHFGFDKGYESLQGSYYWPSMPQVLENAYIPSCAECQQNKTCTSAPYTPWQFPMNTLTLPHWTS